MPRGNAYSRVNWMRQVRRSRSATKARANSIASTSDSLAGPQFAISRPCKTVKSGRSLPLNAELLDLVSNVLCPTNREHPIPGPTSVRTALASTALAGASLAPDDVPESRHLSYPADDGEAFSL